jgi:hypothetical protein
MGPSSEAAWKKAAACDAHAKQTKDQLLRAKFERLRDSWIRIANDAEIASKGEDPERAHAQPTQPSDQQAADKEAA